MHSVPDPRQHQPALALPEGADRDQILAMLTSMSIDGSQAGELDNYAREDCDRFLHTLALIPKGPLKILEIGANPYFLTSLIRKFRPDAELTLLNYFGGATSVQGQTVAVTDTDGTHSQHLEYHNLNLEENDLPFGEGHFDLILYCEVIEHLLNDPVGSLLRLKRVLRTSGALIVTTPNVARLENVAKLISGTNIYDPYSGYGPYGRHNREYNRHELHNLLAYCGFQEEIFFTADVHTNRAGDFADLSAIAHLIESRADDLGQYLFTRCVNAGDAPSRRPGWLYRSYPDDALDLTAAL